MGFPFIMVGGGSITATIKGKTYTVGPDHVNYGGLEEVLRTTQDADEFVRLCDVPRYISTQTEGAVSISPDGESVLWNGQECRMLVANRIIDMLGRKLPIAPMMKFLGRLMENVSYHSRDALYIFMENHGIPVTEDGMVLGYKSVRGDYKDWHSNTYVNSPGSVNEIPRRDVDDNPNVSCSYGFHIGSMEYAEVFHGGQDGHRMVICEFDPADVVSVPCEASENKIRVCKYTVVSDFEGRMDETYQRVSDEVDYEEDLDDEYDDDDDDGDYEDEDYEDDDCSCNCPECLQSRS